MRALLDPKAIAVVGASQAPGCGTSVVVNLRDAGFGGEVFAVNPRCTDVLGYACVPSVNELPDTVDCLVIAIPARAEHFPELHCSDLCVHALAQISGETACAIPGLAREG